MTRTRREPTTFPFHSESSGEVRASVGDVFAHLDDHTRLSSHMSQSSWRMGGGRMETTVDEGGGRRGGSHVRMNGRAFGIALSLDEVVTERTPPVRKVWETVGSPRLLVIGPYRMGFEVTPGPAGSLLKVFIDYALPAASASRWLGRLFGRYYARWCTETMVADAVRHFDRDRAA